MDLFWIGKIPEQGYILQGHGTSCSQLVNNHRGCDATEQEVPTIQLLGVIKTQP
jgi:hypothetical protein